MASETVELILTVTGKPAAAFSEAGEAAARSARDVEGAKNELGRWSDQADATGGAMRKLRGAASSLSPEFGALVNVIDDSADVVELLAGGMTALNPITIGLAAAAAAGGAAWLVYTREAEEAAAALELVIEIGGRAEARTRALEDAQIDLALATGKLSEVEAEAARIRNEQSRGYDDAVAGQKKARAEAEATILANEGMANTLQGLANSGIRGVDTLAILADTVVGFSSKTEAAKSTLAAYDQELEGVARVLEETADAHEETARALDAKAQREKQATAAVKDSSDEERKRREQERANLAASSAAYKAWFAEREEEADQLHGMAALEMADIMAKIEAQQRLAAERTQTTADGVGMAAGGPQAVMGAVANAGPWGAIIAALVDVAGNFADLGDMFDDFTSNFQDSIMELPETLADNLPRWLETAIESVDIAPKFIASLAENLPELLTGIIATIPEMLVELTKALLVELPLAIWELLKTLFSPDMWVGIWDGFVAALKDALGDLLGTNKASGQPGGFFNNGGAFDAIWGGKNENWWGLGDAFSSHADGGTVPRTGPIWAHEGEKVQTRRDVEMGRGGGSTAYSFQFNGFVGSIDDLVERVSQAVEQRNLTLTASGTR